MAQWMYRSKYSPPGPPGNDNDWPSLEHDGSYIFYTHTTDEFSFPTNIDFSDYAIDWGDGTINQGESTHSYSTEGSYRIEVRGKIDGIGTYNNVKKVELLKSDYIESLADAYRDSDMSGTDVFDLICPNVIDVTGMFRNARKFNQKIGGWDTSSWKYTGGLFRDARLFNQPIGNWSTSNFEYLDHTFDGALAFNQNINPWDVSNCVYFGHVFRRTKNYNQPLDKWVVINGEDFKHMFHDAEAFNRNINNWIFQALKGMAYMFNGALKYNQPMGDWYLSMLENQYDSGGMRDSLENFLSGAIDYDQDLSSMNVSGITTRPQSFSDLPANKEPNW